MSGRAGGLSRGGGPNDGLIDLLYEAVSVQLCLTELAAFHERIVLNWINSISDYFNPEWTGRGFPRDDKPALPGVIADTNPAQSQLLAATASGLGRVRGMVYDWTGSVDTGIELNLPSRDRVIQGIQGVERSLRSVERSDWIQGLVAVGVYSWGGPFYVACLYALRLLCIWIRRLLMVLTMPFNDRIRQNKYIEWLATTTGLIAVSGYTSYVFCAATAFTGTIVLFPSYFAIGVGSAVFGAVAVGYRRTRPPGEDYRAVQKFLSDVSNSTLLETSMYIHVGTRLSTTFSDLWDRWIAVREGSGGNRATAVIISFLSSLIRPLAATPSMLRLLPPLFRAMSM